MSEIKIGLSMLFCLGEPFSSLMKHLRKTEIHYVEIVDEGLHALSSRRVSALKKIGHSQDFEFAIHAPFADINIASPAPILRHAILKRLKKSILCASQLDCKLWIFHPGSGTGLSFFHPGLDWQLNLDSVRVLLKIARKYDVEIAIENVPEPHPFLMKNVNEFSRFYNELEDDIGLVFDIAHAHLNHQIQDFITQFADKIVHIHASDNDGKDDLHLGIGHGTINWKSVVKAIKKVGYDKVVTLESVGHVEESLQTLQKLFT